VPGPLAVAGSFPVGRAGQAFDIEVHQPVEDERHHFAEEIRIRALLDELGKV
jgi:hypothetical protein